MAVEVAAAAPGRVVAVEVTEVESSVSVPGEVTVAVEASEDGITVSAVGVGAREVESPASAPQGGEAAVAGEASEDETAVSVSGVAVAVGVCETMETDSEEAVAVQGGVEVERVEESESEVEVEVSYQPLPHDQSKAG